MSLIKKEEMGQFFDGANKQNHRQSLQSGANFGRKKVPSEKSVKRALKPAEAMKDVFQELFFCG